MSLTTCHPQQPSQRPDSHLQSRVCLAPSRCSVNISHSDFSHYSGLIQLYLRQLYSKGVGGGLLSIRTQDSPALTTWRRCALPRTCKLSQKLPRTFDYMKIPPCEQLTFACVRHPFEDLQTLSNQTPGATTSQAPPSTHSTDEVTEGQSGNNC